MVLQAALDRTVWWNLVELRRLKPEKLAPHRNPPLLTEGLPGPVQE